MSRCYLTFILKMSGVRKHCCRGHILFLFGVCCCLPSTQGQFVANDYYKNRLGIDCRCIGVLLELKKKGTCLVTCSAYYGKKMQHNYSTKLCVIFSSLIYR